MKNQVLQVALFVLAIALIGCQDEKKEEVQKGVPKTDEFVQSKTADLKACAERNVDPDFEDLTFHYSINKKECHYQPLHLDMVNGFGILGKVKSKKDGVVKKIDFRLKEVKDLERYTISDTVDYMECPIDSNKSVHHIYFYIDEYRPGDGSSRNDKAKFKAAQDANIRLGDTVDLHFYSLSSILDLKIPSPTYNAAGKCDSIDPKSEENFVYFGNNICKSFVVD